LLKVTALRESGEYDQARRDLDFVLRASPQNVGALFQLGLLEIERRNFASAATAFAKLQDLDSAGGAGGLAAVFEAQGQSGKALELLKKTVTRLPNNTSLRALLARIAINAKEYDLALDQYRALMAKDPRSAAPYLGLAEAYRLKGDLKSSIGSLE